MTAESLLAQEREAILNYHTEPMAFKVEAGALKRYAECLGEGNPLYTDEAYAAKGRYGGLVAMPVFFSYFNPFHWGVPFPPSPYPVSASAGDEFEFYLPVRPGDTITTGERFIDAYEKQGGRGRLFFIVDERIYTNQKGEVVGKSHWTGVRWNPGSRPAAAGAAAPELPARFHGYRRQRPPDYRAEITLPPAGQVSFADVAEGTEITPLRRTLSHELFVRFAGYNNEFSRHHVDYLFAAAAGWRDCIAQGLLGSCYLSKMMTDWIGEAGTLRRVKGTYRAPGYPGDLWTCKGKVVKKYQHNGENLVDCEVWVENQDGVKVTPGVATAALPG